MSQVLASVFPNGATPASRGKGIVASGEMADRVRAYAWSATTLGPLESWSEPLLCSVNLMLSCQFPTVIFWGSRMLQLYNDAYLPLMAEKHPGALGQSARECWKEAWHLIGPQFEAVLSEGETTYREKVLVPVVRHGRLQDIYWTYSYSPIFDFGGERAGVLIVCQDVTGEFLAGREREAASKQLAQVLEATTDGVLSLDRDWRFTYLNSHGREILSGSGDLLGKNAWEAFPAMIYEGSPYVHHYNRAMNEGLGGEFETKYPEPLNMWLQVSVRPSRDGIIIFFRNVTEQRRATAALRESGARLNAMYSTSLAYIALLTPQGRILDCNRASLEFGGGTREATIGLCFWDGPWFLHTPGAPRRVEQFVARAAAGETIRDELRLVRASGETILFDFSISPVRNDVGEVTFLVPEARDITEQKRTEAALVQSEKLAVVGRMASSIAHEINNPLESITNLIYLAHTSEAVPREVREYLDLAERELRRLSIITHQTLSLQRQAAMPTPVSCQELIEGGLSIYQGRIVNSRVKVEQRMRAFEPVRCFDGEIRQVINNLLGNALDALHPTGGRLLIRSRTATQWRSGERGLMLTFADTGGGMTPEVQLRIFEPFFTTKGIGGTGLGLWVSREIVGRHHGELRVRSSRREGRSGTVFTLFLPFNAVDRLVEGRSAFHQDLLARHI